jgi:glycosyltransferase involved in cell wall biosynthesis
MSAHAGSAHAAPAATPFVPLTIHWLVSEPIAGSGGHTGIFRMIRHLVDFGHVCHVHMIPVNFMHGYTPAELQRHVDDHFFPTGAVYHQWDGTIGPADATVATFWRTVPPLLKLPLPGRRYYLVQDFEPYFYPMGLEYIQAEETYRQGLHCLTLGPWLASFLHEHYGAQADAFDFAVDTNVYYPAAVPRPPHRRVAFYARPSTPRRAYELGLEALALVKQRDPSVEIIFFGAEHHPPAPFPVTNAGLLNPWELAGLFSTCDVGVVFSTTNPSFVPFELMACRCAVVDLASERVAGLLEDGVNCRLAAPTPQAVAAAVLDLLWGSEARAAIVETAYRQVKASSWQQSARQIEAVMLAHTPPAQRVAAQMAAGDDVDVLAWQIHQLLDTGADSAALVDALRTTLYRTLAEKAALVQHVQAVEQRLAAAEAAAPTAGPRAALQPLADTLLDRAPAWLLGSLPVSKLALGQETLCQTFVADRSHLRRIELRFAPHAALHTGSLLVSLYEGSETLAGGRLVLSTILRAAELPLDAPCALDFPPQPASYGQTYTLCLAAAELQRHPPAIWHFKAARFGGALSVRRTPAGSPPHDEPLGGAVAFQPFYGERPPLLGPRHDPGDWHTPVRLAPAVARDLAARRAEELRRLGGQARTAVTKGGVRGLVAEIRSYLEWQLSGRRGE